MGDQKLAGELNHGMDTLKQVSVLRVRDGQSISAHDVIAVEVPVALEYNGISHVVMLASPADLDDFALGFSLSEGIIAQSSELYGCEAELTHEGWLLHLDIASERFAALKERRRNLAGRTGCGLCGTESLSQVARCSTTIVHRHHVAEDAVLNGMRAMHHLQPMQRLSGATHAAAWMNAQGQVELVREDVGRHNALDKLIGVLAKQKQDFSTGVLLITSRASYEMVQKAAIMNIGVVAAISAPTSFAVELADHAGVTLMGFMRDQSYVVYTHADRLDRNDLSNQV
ncbi:MAG: formate dehydrogenase accessory sulfurtransferase FdhD [Oxalobacteraceae bacterium]|jgi:FdhD protein|nr:formate dehydrogenase accessory sulfurtransferase FdhD [Oxalobacteraceae bacterium]